MPNCLNSANDKKFSFIRLLRIVSFFPFRASCPRPPLWSSGQSSWIQIRRPGFDSRHYKGKSLERGPPSLVSTTEELLDRKVAAPVLENREYGRRDPSR
jgi:hypothetical protein